MKFSSLFTVLSLVKPIVYMKLFFSYLLSDKYVCRIESAVNSEAKDDHAEDGHDHHHSDHEHGHHDHHEHDHGWSSPFIFIFIFFIFIFYENLINIKLIFVNNLLTSMLSSVDIVWHVFLVRFRTRIGRSTL